MIRSSFLFLSLLISLFSCRERNSNLVLESKEIKGNWTFAQQSEGKWLPAVVPGNVHMDLLRNKKIPDPFFGTNETDLQWIEKENWEYKTSFAVSEEQLSNENIDLVFKGLDTYADVYLNESKLLSTFNMFREWKLKAKKHLRLGENQLRIVLRSPINETLPLYDSLAFQYPANNDQAEKKVSIFTRKAGYHFGWDWGPRFVTSGIWRPILLESWNRARIQNVQLVQQSLTEKEAVIKAFIEIEASTVGKVKLELKGEESVTKQTVEVAVKPGINKTEVTFLVSKPEKWWPNGLGNARLYEITSSLYSEQNILHQTKQKIGLRTIELVDQKDDKGKSFYFKVNGSPVFMKGANYIPSDNFQNRIGEDKYQMLVKSAVDANMNMLRVWGGGIYEEDRFYEICDEKGIMVWQDFMFGCSMYPGNEAFLKNVEQEAVDNVKRLRNHPSIVMWCGNNEIETAWKHWGWQKQHGWTEEQQGKMWEDYTKLFHDLLPKVIAQYDPSRAYHRSSPSADDDHIDPDTLGSGDKHYWGVWHAEEPYTAYKDNISRFMSEYGFQSFPELKTVASYIAPEDTNIESKVMLHHQRHPRGNQLIKEYMDRDYKKPKDFASFLYVGQVLQAEIIKYAAESHRRAMPFNMGSLFWQLDDCWPVASWSGIDYYGRWKAQHYFAKKFFQPVLVSLDEDKGLINAYVVSDNLKPIQGTLSWRLMDFSGDTLWKESKDTLFAANASQIYLSVEKTKLLKGKISSSNVVLVAELTANNQVVSTSRYYFTQAKNLKLSTILWEPSVTQDGNKVTIVLRSDVLAKNVYLRNRKYDGFFSDNYFDLLPGEEKTVTFQSNENLKLADFSPELQINSLVDSYK